MPPTIEHEPRRDSTEADAASGPQPKDKRAQPRKTNAPWDLWMMKLAIHFCIGLIILHSILIGLIGTVKLADDKFSHANRNLQMLSDTRDAQLEFVSRRFTHILYSGPGLSKKFGETHVQCYERGLDHIYAGFGGLDFMKYADYSHDVEQWVQDECSRLFFTPQDPQKRFSLDSDIDTLRYRARKLIEKIGVRVAEDSRTFNAWYDNQVIATSKRIKRVFGDGAAKLWVDLLTWRMPKLTKDKPTIPSPPTQPTEPDMIECTEDAIFGHPPPCARVIEKHPDWVITRGSHNSGRLEYAPSALHKPEAKFRETIQIARSRAAILQRIAGFWKTANKLTTMLSYVIMAYTYSIIFLTAIVEALNYPSRLISVSDRTPAALRNSFALWTSLLLSTQLFRSALSGDWISVLPTSMIWIGVSGGLGLFSMYLVPNNPPWPTVWGLSAVFREYRTASEQYRLAREEAKKKSCDGAETVRELVNKYLTPLKKPEAPSEAPTTPNQRPRSLSISSQATASDKKRNFTPNSTLQEDIAATVAAERAEAGWAAESKEDDHMDESFEQIQGQHEDAADSRDLEAQSNVSTISFTNSEMREMASNFCPVEVPTHTESDASSDSEMDDMSFPLEGTRTNKAFDTVVTEDNTIADAELGDALVDVTIGPDELDHTRVADTSSVGDDIVEITISESTSDEDEDEAEVATDEPASPEHESSEDDESSQDDETSEDDEDDEGDDTFQEIETFGAEPVQVAYPEDTGAESGSDWSVVSDSP